VAQTDGSFGEKALTARNLKKGGGGENYVRGVTKSGVGTWGHYVRKLEIGGEKERGHQWKGYRSGEGRRDMKERRGVGDGDGPQAQGSITTRRMRGR